MAPASDSSPPPADGPKTPRGGGCGADEGEGQGQAGESTGQGESTGRGESMGQDNKGNGQAGETYGPLDIARRLKDDGRVLILYTRRKREEA